jgi:antitoxin FitA
MFLSDVKIWRLVPPSGSAAGIEESDMPDASITAQGLDMWLTCKHVCHMAKMIQVRNVPDEIHARLKARAAMAGMSLSDYLLRELRHIAELPTLEEMRMRLQSHPPVTLSESPEDAVRAERDAR